MAKNLLQLVNTAEEQLINTMSGLLKHQFENGVNVLMELDNSLQDEYMRIGEIVAEQVIPPKKTDIQSILKSDTKDILESCDLMKEVGAISLEDYAKLSIHEIMKRSIAFVIVKYFIDYAPNIKERMFVQTCQEVSRQYSEENLSDKNFILSLLEETGHGWPIIIAKNDLDKDVQIVLKAFENDPWTLDYINKDLRTMIGENEPIAFLSNLLVDKQSIRKSRP